MTMQKLKQNRILWIATLIILFGALALMFNNPGMLYANNTWEATYWNNPIFSGEPVLQRYEAEINYDWAGLSPDPVVNVDNFSVRWRTVMQADSGVYRFSATTDDGMKVLVDGQPVINAWYDSKVHTVTADVPLNAGPHQIVVEYYEAGGVAIAKVNWAMISSNQPMPPPSGSQPMPPPSGGQPMPPPAPMPPPSNQGWQGQYYNNKDLGGDPALVRTDSQIKFNWGTGSPAPNIQSDNFSVRWTTNLNLPAGKYRFNTTTDDGARLWVNNQLLIDQWFDHPVTTFSAEIDLPGGAVPVQMEYYENLQLAEAALTWQNLSGSGNPGNPGTGGPFPTAIVTASYLNVRQGPGANYAVITTVTKGTELRLAGYRNADGSWVQAILPNNVKGWVNSSYIHTDYPIENLKVWPNSGNQPSGSTATITANYLNVRYGPGTSYGVFNTLQKGQTVIMNGRNANGTWVQVRLPDGNIGWVNASYINPSRPISELPIVG